jgi:DNA-3-methyladenine glycosylase
MSTPRFDDILPLEFFERDAHELARELLGHLVVRRTDAGLAAGRIVELEVYGGIDDPACHADRGTPTERTRSMFGAPGIAYVYRIYGMYDCLNVVAPRGAGGKASALLVRALEPVTGLEQMARRRGIETSEPLTKRDRRKLLSGPGKLCQALSIDRDLDGDDLQSDPLWLARGESVSPDAIERTPRIGLNPRTCGESTHFEWRYVVADSRFLSR